jgi:2-polyprenyl-6-methoxyphenol hydroxylase-like FAD-dependent oxidoreductase
MHARTLEFYRQVGLAEAVVERGLELVAANLWAIGSKAARVVFGAMGQGLSPFPYGLIFAQDQHERLLIERLAESGVSDAGIRWVSWTNHWVTFKKRESFVPIMAGARADGLTKSSKIRVKPAW